MGTKNLINKLLLISLTLQMLSCGNEDKNIEVKMTKNDFIHVSEKKIFFGHQSVGANIIDGIEDFKFENNFTELSIIDGNTSDIFKTPVFAHYRIGKNKYPRSKIDEFKGNIIDELGGVVDIAGFKFCFADINRNTNVYEVFEYYKLVMNEISRKYPNLKIMHFTVPLRTVPTGIKARIKRLFGEEFSVPDNLKRQEYNNLILNEYDRKVIFDIARNQSTHSNGDREYTFSDGDKVYSMVHSYSDDGGHLSKLGRHNIGVDFLSFLEALSNEE